VDPLLGSGGPELDTCHMHVHFRRESLPCSIIILQSHTLPSETLIPRMNINLGSAVMDYHLGRSRVNIKKDLFKPGALYKSR
jgi:hypothetical protein